MVVQWLGLCTSMPRAWVQSLVGILRPHKLYSTTNKEKKRKKNRGWDLPGAEHASMNV